MVNEPSVGDNYPAPYRELDVLSLQGIPFCVCKNPLVGVWLESGHNVSFPVQSLLMMSDYKEGAAKRKRPARCRPFPAYKLPYNSELALYQGIRCSHHCKINTAAEIRSVDGK